MAPFGYWAAFRTLPFSVALTLLGVPIAYFMINAGYHYWDGGWSTGPRHVVASLPFLVFPLVFLWQRSGSGMRIALAGLALISGAISLVCASVTMTAPDSDWFAGRLGVAPPNPLFGFLLPSFLRGTIRNPLTIFEIIPSLLTLGVIPLLWLAAAALTAPWRSSLDESPTMTRREGVGQVQSPGVQVIQSRGLAGLHRHPRGALQ